VAHCARSERPGRGQRRARPSSSGASRHPPLNLESAKLDRPEPAAAEGEVVLNDAYREMAAHYSAAVLPGRVRHPKDKASVENTVSHVATWVIAGLRKEVFTSLAQLRRRIRGADRCL